MTFSLDAIGAKIKRAEKHIADYRAAIQSFKGTNPYEIVRQPEIKSAQIVYNVNRVDPVPLPIRAIAADVIQNFRTALDYLACAIVPAPTTSTYFPILKQAPTPDQIKTAFDGKIKGASQSAIDKIASLKPYKGGNDVLWRLHELNKRDKHSLLVATYASLSRFDLRARYHGEPSPDIDEMLAETLAPVKGGFPLQEGSQVFVDAPPPESHQDVNLFVEVVVNEPNVCEGRPLITVLLESRREVARVVGLLRFDVLR
jgi:hypothetical protein